MDVEATLLKEEIEMHPYIAKVKAVSDPVPTVAQQYLQEAVLEEDFQNMEDSRFTILFRRSFSWTP